MADTYKEPERRINHNPFDYTRIFIKIIWISIICVFTIGILDLAGWKFDLKFLVSFLPNSGDMKAITAVCLILSALSLAIVQINFPVIYSKILPRLFGVLICAIAIITIYIYLFYFLFGQESDLTGKSYLAFAIGPQSRMDLLTSINIFITGCMIYLLPGDKKRTSDIVHALIIIVILISYFSIVGYLLGVYKITDIDHLTVSLNTAIAFWGLSVAILLMRPETWLLRVFTSSSTGNIIARRLLPGLMILPVVIGWLRIKGEQNGLFISEVGVVLVAITYTVCFFALVWYTVRSVNLVDSKRLEYEKALQETALRLNYHYENSPLAVVEWGNDFKITQWSLEAERIFGWKKEEVIGRRIDALNIIYEEDIPIVEDVMRRFNDGEEDKVVSSNRNYTKNGEVIECVWNNTVMKDETGHLSSVMSLVQDVTSLRNTERALKESRESYKELVTNARTIIVKVDTEGKFTFANEYAQNFFGFSLDEMLGKTVMETIVPQRESTGRDLREMVEEIYEDPDRFSININENVKKNGERIWVEWHNKALFDKYGNRTGHTSIGIDITARKKAEESLKESRENLSSVLNATQESIYMFDRDNRIRMANSTALIRLKKTEEEVIGHNFSEFMTPSLARTRREKIEEVFSSGKPLMSEDERAGTYFHHNFFPVFMNSQVEFVVCYSADITEQKKAEARLKESEDHFRTIAESIPVLISINKISDPVILFANESYEKAFGFQNGETKGKAVHDLFVNNEDRKYLAATLAAKGEIYNTEFKVKKIDGSPFWVMTSIKTIMFGNDLSYLTASIDITENKNAQEELLMLNRTLDAHNKSSQTMMHSYSEFYYLNEVCRIIIEDCGYRMVWIGYAMNDPEKSVKPVAHAGFNEGYLEQLDIRWDNSKRGRGPTGTAIRTGKPSVCLDIRTDPSLSPWRDEALKRGYLSSLVLPIVSDKTTIGAISIYSDKVNAFFKKEILLLSDLANDLAYGISHIRLEESQKAALKAIEKSEAELKELNATKDKFFNIIAHDLKNPFTSLLGSSEIIYNKVDQMSRENIKKLTLILNDSAKGGFAILQNLLDWSRSQTGTLQYNPEMVNLKKLIDFNISNLQLTAFNKEIKLNSEIKEDIIFIADKNMINTLLRNLLNNAVKFTRRHGEVLISAWIESEDVIVSVKDNGIGISEENIGKLFRIDTKYSIPGTEKEQGTGLGLKLCKEFVIKMGGNIWVESTENMGSEFKFSLPFKKN